MVYNFYNDPSKSGTPVNVDKLNSSVMNLKSTVDSLEANKVYGPDISIWKGTQEEYNNLSEYSSQTIYFVK